MSPALPILRLESATLRRGDRVLLEPVTLELVVGERLCVAGPPASGKSLLLEVMAGRHTLASGSRSYPAFAVWHADSRLGVMPRFSMQLVSTEEQRRLATQVASFHQARWHAQFSEPETVSRCLEARRVLGLNDFEVVTGALLSPDHELRKVAVTQQLGIAHLLERRVAALSNGEMRKLLIARAILARPRLLLLDDPLGGLDPDARRAVIDALAGLCESEPGAPRASQSAWLEPGHAMTLVIATPRPEEVAQLTTRSYILAPKGASVPPITQQVDNKVLAVGADDTCPPRAASGARLVKLNCATVKVPGTTILDRVSLEVRDGEHWLITGPNGSGKSTLLALLLGDHPQSYVADLEVLGARAQPGVPLFERQRRLGFMAPELAMHYPPGWTVNDVVTSGFGATIGQFREVSSVERELVERWMSRLKLTHCSNVPLGALSEAEQRRALLARALVRQPTLLLLDEPTQGLADAERHEMHDLLDATAANSATTLLVVSHHPEERPLCISHHLALKLGRVVFAGPLAH